MVRRIAVWLTLSLWFLSTITHASVEIEIQDSDQAEIIKQNVEAYLGTVFATDAEGLQRYSRRAVQQTQQALQALGYYRATVKTEVVQSNDDARLVMVISPGPVTRVASMHLEILGELQSDVDFRIPVGLLPQHGDPLNHGRYEDSKNLLMSMALNRGYLDARLVRKELLIDPNRNEAYITLVLDSGRRYHLGDLSFKGGKLSESLLRRYVRFERGIPYDIQILNRLNQDLQESGYFDSVQVIADPANAENYVVPVQVIMTATPRNRVNMGGGISTDVGLQGKINWTNVRLNDLGERIGASLKASQYETTFSTFWSAPQQHPQTDWLTLRFSWQTEAVDETRNNEFQLGGELSDMYSNQWLQTTSLNWIHSTFNIGDENPQVEDLLIPAVSWNRRITDGALDPDQGLNFTFDVSGSDPWLSSLDFVRWQADLRALVSLSQRQRLLARTQVGSMETSNFSSLPPSLRFYAGGDQSVRGYDYRSLGPTDDNGNVTGGTHLLVGSLEYAYEFIPDWSVALFVDRGSTGLNWEMPLFTGAGAGIHWHSPLGQIRLDLAYGISEDPVPRRIHLSMGPGL